VRKACQKLKMEEKERKNGEKIGKGGARRKKPPF
jgi:hypothetical protein